MLIVLAVNWPPQAPAPGHARVLDLVQLLEADLARPVRADRLEHAHDRVVALALVDARVDRAVVEDDARDVEPAQRHGRARGRLVAADQADEAVEQVAARDQLDRVGDDLAADERGLHALGAHRHAVADTETVLNSIGVPPAARMPSLTNSARRRWLKLQGIVSIHCVATPDDRLGEVLVGEADRLEHRARGGAVGAVGQGGGMALGGIGGAVVGQVRHRAGVLRVA